MCSVPGLDLNCSVIPYYADEVLLSFIDKLLELSESSLLTVKVKRRNTMIDGFKDRLSAMIDRGTQHLDVESSTYYYEDGLGAILPCVDFMPMNLYTSKTLVYLKLSFSDLGILVLCSCLVLDSCISKKLNGLCIWRNLCRDVLYSRS
ncbi:unnamed protein product [Brassica napus]|nr:unnamed protein product [Brassica napus]